MISTNLTTMLVAIWILMSVSIGFGQDSSPQSAMSDSFSDYDRSGGAPLEVYWGARWEKGSLSNCIANQSVNVNYNIPNGRLEISSLANASEVNINGFKSKWKMNLRSCQKLWK